MAGQLVGRVLRSPHAHAKIRKIDTSKAEKLNGVKAVITAADLPDLTNGDAGMYDILDNCMAREKALYDGHAVAAVAAVDARTARQALKLIEVDYEVLPHVTDVDEAMKPSAPVLQRHHLHRGRRAEAQQAVQRRQAQPSTAMATSRQGFEQADCHRRTLLQDRADAPGLYRAACLRGERQLRRHRRPLGLHAGPFRLPPALRAAARHGRLEAARHLVGDRRRFRRQDPCLGRAGRAGAVAQGGPAGQAGHDARRGVPRLGADQRDLDRRQDRRPQGRHDHRGRGDAALFMRRPMPACGPSSAP